jgi:hypothetical protein
MATVDKDLIDASKLWKRLKWILDDYTTALYRMNLSEKEGIATQNKLSGISNSLDTAISRILNEMLLEKGEGHTGSKGIRHLPFLLSLDIKAHEIDRIYFEEAYSPLLGKQKFDGYEDISMWNNNQFRYHQTFPIYTFIGLLELFNSCCNDRGANRYIKPTKTDLTSLLPAGEDYQIDEIFNLGLWAKSQNDSIWEYKSYPEKKELLPFKKVKLNRLIKACYDSFNILAEYFGKMDKERRSILTSSILSSSHTRGFPNKAVPHLIYYAMIWQEQVSLTNPSQNVIEFCNFLQEQIRKNDRMDRRFYDSYRTVDSSSTAHGGLLVINLVHPSKLEKQGLEIKDKYGYHQLVKRDEYEQYISINDILNHYVGLKK